ncbi:ABC transporter substrate-binding protein [Granulosicoccus sp. 3-233]|uniref:ABC transporter substrate-binding protein n=1 Tax=Granulosicoccus sp. 3-233 TaxID=3417969 RepID=UPI003D3397F1
MLRRCTKRLIAFAVILASALLPVGTHARSLSIGQTFLAAGLDPAEGSNGWALVSHGIAEQLFHVSQEGKVEPNLAVSATVSDDGIWTLQLARDRYYSDGSPMTAELVAAGLNRTGEANPSARSTAGRLTFTAIDDLVLQVESEQPTPILPSILAEWAFPVYKLVDGVPIFTGPYMVKAFEAGSSLELLPNPYHAGAADRPELNLRRIADGQSLALAFASGELDMAFNLPVESLPMLSGVAGRTVSFPVEYQYMMWMNTHSPALADVRVRKAIDKAINRNDLVTAAQAGLAATGAFPANSPFATTDPLIVDTTAAGALLDEAGWLVGDDGKRHRQGQSLSLVLYAYPQRPDLVTFQPVIRSALAELGIDVTTQVTESPSELAAAGEFDLFLWAQHTAPAGDPAQFLTLFLETDAARNYSGWSNPQYDALIAELRSEADSSARIDLARQAQDIIAADVPMAFLVTPEWHVGLSAALSDYEPWGSDYYIIRPDLIVEK